MEVDDAYHKAKKIEKQLQQPAPRKNDSTKSLASSSGGSKGVVSMPQYC